MGLAEVSAKIRGVALHLVNAETGRYECRTQRTENTLHTYAPEKATCKWCIADYKKRKDAQEN